VAEAPLPRAQRPLPAPTPASAPAGPRFRGDAFLLATGTDSAETGGVAHSQRELGEELSRAILAGEILCCPTTVAPTAEAQAAKALRMFEAVGVRTRGSRYPPVRSLPSWTLRSPAPAPLLRARPTLWLSLRQLR